MQTLTPVLGQPGDTALLTARVLFKNGREIYLCDEFSEIEEAMESHSPFKAHEVVSFRPSEIIVNPSAVASVARAE